MSLLPLTPQVFTILRSFIEEHTGITYSAADRELLGDKLSTRALQAGFESLLDYYYFLRYDEGGKAELDALIDAIVVNETYFFREPDQLRVLLDTLLAPLLRVGARPRVWCAASSTGEEPLTLAMMLDERNLLGRVEIVATDISVRALARCAAGLYGGRALRAIGKEHVDRYLTPVAPNQHAVRTDLTRAIQWKRVNLIDHDAVRALGVFDAILCRNVLIYFAEPMVLSVVSALAGQLRPGGYLCVGASESLLRFGTQLACEEHGGAFFYRKER